MQTIKTLIKRNTKLFFKDKGTFFTSLITPIILLVLYVTFLGNIYRDSFLSSMNGVPVSDELVGGFVGAQLFSSLLAVSCVTVAFCSNMLMVQDKISGAYGDLTIAPVKKSKLGFAYFISAEITTLIVAIVAAAASFIYLAFEGWYLSVSDVLFLFLDIFLLATFGTLLSSVVNFFLSTQGQVSAVGSIVSSGYGFICGAYMPLSQFGEGLRTVLGFLPGTYGTSLIRNNAMRGVLEEMKTQNFPEFAIEGLKDAFDLNLYFFDTKVELWVMYLILTASILLLLVAYILINKLTEKKKNK